MTPKKKHEAVASITLAELTTRYVAHMETEGKSLGTRFSYESELKLAQRELGAELSIGAISREDIETFNNCPRVTILKSGRPKSQLSIDKTRRVLRLALKWAQDTKLIEASPAESIEERPTKTRGAKKNEPASEPAPVEQQPKRRRKQAITLEVSQPDAERAADAAESMIAATNPESAA